ncbi:putative disease resistance protein At1g58400 [Coffea arabica]|uniref:Disease resistance protein At1g58400 n=1 Tax=Coffea arabica TaxID=13443 RepID=A0A6P6WS20_COFAR|nr:probable disease resistance protein RF9 [Coffea arabica]
MVVAEQYLTELASRSMVNVELNKSAILGLKYEHCLLHDLMRELYLMNCSEEDYVKVVDFQGGRQPVLERCPVIMDDITTTNTYRLAIHTDGNFKGDVIGKITERLSPRLRPLLLSIRVKVKIVRCKMDKLPLQVLNLPFLQSLNLQGSVWTNPTKIPKLDIAWKAKRLRHLFFPNNGAKMVDQGKFRLCGLVQLEEIIDFDTSTMEGHVVLGICNCNFTENESGTNSNLVRKVFNRRHLIGLAIERSLGNKLPRYETNFASSLRHLALYGSEIVEDPMKILENLPNLRELQLLMNSFMGKEMDCHNMGFLSLTDLSLKGLHSLEK